MLRIDPSAKISDSARLVVTNGEIKAGVVIRDGCSITADELLLEQNVDLGERVTIRAEKFRAGFGTRIERDCRFAGIGAPAREIDLGDHDFLGESNNILLPRFVAGDYVAMHHHLLANGYEDCTIGHNTWIGQNCVLNATARLTIGNNVGIGAYSSVYTHAFNGELLEGCEVFNVGPVTIEDNVWIVGSYNVISPGVTLGKKSMILTSSVVSKNVPPMHTVAGVPAKDLTDKLKPFREVTLEEKVTMMRKFAGELEAAIGDRFRVVVLDDASAFDDDGKPAIVYAAKGSIDAPHVTRFDLGTKTYRKRRTAHEIEAIRFMNGYRARFVPEDRPVVR